MRRKHCTCTENVARVQKTLHVYRKRCTCTENVARVHKKLHVYRKRCTCTKKVARVQKTLHMYKKSCTCTENVARVQKKFPWYAYFYVQAFPLLENSPCVVLELQKRTTICNYPKDKRLFAYQAPNYVRFDLRSM